MMNLQEMKLTDLIPLWEVSGGNITFKNKIEIELQNRIKENFNFSREFVFDICKTGNHAITISFIPTSKAYNIYGSSLTIDMILTEEELWEMRNNVTSNPPINTSGNIKAKILVKGRLSEEQIEEAKNFGFHTSEIFEIL